MLSENIFGFGHSSGVYRNDFIDVNVSLILWISFKAESRIEVTDHNTAKAAPNISFVDSPLADSLCSFFFFIVSVFFLVDRFSSVNLISWIKKIFICTYISIVFVHWIFFGESEEKFYRVNSWIMCKFIGLPKMIAVILQKTISRGNHSIDSHN